MLRTREKYDTRATPFAMWYPARAMINFYYSIAELISNSWEFQQITW